MKKRKFKLDAFFTFEGDKFFTEIVDRKISELYAEITLENYRKFEKYSDTDWINVDRKLLNTLASLGEQCVKQKLKENNVLFYFSDRTEAHNFDFLIPKIDGSMLKLEVKTIPMGENKKNLF